MYKTLKRLNLVCILGGLITALIPEHVVAGGEADSPPVLQPLFRVADLNIGESETLKLSDGSRAKVTLLEVEEIRDELRSAIRLAKVKVDVNGIIATVESGNYRLPITVGDVQLDCPATSGLYLRRDLFEDSWGLDKKARLRVWPKGSPWIEPGSFVYPIRQRWFGNATQAGNEPSYVMGEDAPTSRNIYYHAGNDIGGVEGLDQVIAAADGLVISTGGKTLETYPDLPFYQQSSYATVYVVDAHGWIFRYTHMKSIDPSVHLGEMIKKGAPIGILGREEGAGYYSHLHFDIKSRKPSGKWGVEDAYPFLWEAYLREHRPAVIAVARPHILAREGDTVTLDGSRSWAESGKIDRYEWTFTNGETATGPQVPRRYEKPGRYSEILHVTDTDGNSAYDFAIVDVVEKDRGDRPSPGIHAAYFPSQHILPNQEVTFVVRTSETIPSGETWDFGDGSPSVQVRSDASTGTLDHEYAVTTHAFARPGDYLVRAEHTTQTGAVITARLHVRVEEGDNADSRHVKYRIETVAGNGQPGDTPVAGGKAVELPVDLPFGVVEGPDKAYYITTVGSHRVLRLDLDHGTLTSVAGNGTKGFAGDGGLATNATLNEPYEVRFDSAGNMLILEMQNHLLRRVDSQTGIISTLAGDGVEGDRGDGGPAKHARFHNPHSFILDGNDNIYIADQSNHRVRKIDPRTARIETVAGTGEKGYPTDGGMAREQPLIYPQGLAIQDGQLWIVSVGGNVLWRMDLASGVIRRVAGSGERGYTGDGGDPLLATFDGPRGMTISPQGILYLVEGENNLLRAVDPNRRQIWTIAGAGPGQHEFVRDGVAAVGAPLWQPHGVCVTPDGSILISDTINHRVRILIPESSMRE